MKKEKELVPYVLFSCSDLLSIGSPYYQGGYDVIGDEKHLVLKLLTHSVFGEFRICSTQPVWTSPYMVVDLFYLLALD
jgi:hypothetical protein